MMNTLQNQDTIFPKGNQAPEDYFTGIAWVNILVPGDKTGTYGIGNVVFEPGCRNNWHTHPAGQILLVTEGTGWYQEKNRPARVITKGDVIVVPADIEHWHGASKNNSLTHIAITNNLDGLQVEWKQCVTDQEYNSLDK
jgi:4-carboxymuconolactone decarboxylase